MSTELLVKEAETSGFIFICWSANDEVALIAEGWIL